MQTFPSTAADAFLLAAGIAFLVKGAGWLVDGACGLAARVRVSQRIIGLTLVSFGTSLPELFVNVASRLEGRESITLGDVFGSNIANILLVLGTVLTVRPVAFRRGPLLTEILFAFTASALLVLTAAAGTFEGLTRPEGAVFLGIFLIFLYYVYRTRKDGLAEEAQTLTAERPILVSSAKTASGIAALALGAQATVDGAAGVSAALGIPEFVVALTVVAVGTSLPELVTSVVAAAKNRAGIAVGNVVGSNIFNICWILGVSAAFRPLPIPARYGPDMAAGAAAVLLLFAAVFFSRKSTLDRRVGWTFVLLYAVYVANLIGRAVS